MISSGVPILDALEVVAKTAGNRTRRGGHLLHARQDQRGQDHRRAVGRDRGLPADGRADDRRRRGDRRHGPDAQQDRRLLRRRGRRRRSTALTSMIEPVMMVFLGGVVGGFLIAHVPAHLQHRRRHQVAGVSAASRMRAPAGPRGEEGLYRRLVWLTLLRIVAGHAAAWEPRRWSVLERERRGPGRRRAGPLRGDPGDLRRLARLPAAPAPLAAARTGGWPTCRSSATCSSPPAWST